MVSGRATSGGAIRSTASSPIDPEAATLPGAPSVEPHDSVFTARSGARKLAAVVNRHLLEQVFGGDLPGQRKEPDQTRAQAAHRLLEMRIEVGGGPRGDTAARPTALCLPRKCQHALLDGTDDPPRGIPAAVNRSSGAEVSQVNAPGRAVPSAFAEHPDRGIKLGEHPGIELANAFR